MAEERVIGFRIVVNGSEKVVKSIAELEAEIKKANKQLKEVPKGSKDYERLSNEIANSKAQLQDVRKEQRLQIKEAQGVQAATGSYKQLNAQLIRAKAEFRELSRVDRESQRGETLVKQIQALDKELKDLDKTIGQSFRNVGNYESAFDGLTLSVESFVKNLPAIAISAATTALVQGTTAAIEAARAFETLRGEVEQLTGLTGQDLDEFSIRTKAIADTFNLTTEEVAQSVNALTKNVTGDFRESFDVIEEGLIAGANAQGELIDGIREYSTFIGEAGLSGRQFVQIINQSAKEGLFSDKGIDSVKEAVLSLRELPKTAEDALNAIGITGDEIGDIISSEGIGKAIAFVSERLGEFEDDSREVGQVLADVFKGAGEDAGVNFVKSLVRLGGEYDELAGAATQYAEFQSQILEVNKELARSTNDLTKEIEAGNDAFTVTSIQLKTVFNDVLVTLIRNLKGAVSFFGQVQIQLASLGSRFPRLTSAITTFAKGFLLVIQPALQIFTVDFPAALAGFQEAAKQVAINVGSFFTNLGQRFQLTILGFQKSIARGDAREQIRREINLIKAERQNATESGRSIGDAYNEGFNKVVQDRTQQRAIADSLKKSNELAREQAAKDSEKLGQQQKDALQRQQEELEKIEKFGEIGSIKRLEQDIKDLKEEIEKSNLSNDEFLKKSDELSDLETELSVKIARRNDLLREQAGLNEELADLSTKTIENEIELNDKLIKEKEKGIQKSIDLAKKQAQEEIEIINEKEKEKKEQRIEREQELIDASIQLANELASSSFDIAASFAEAEKEQRLQILDDEFNARFERIKGNEQEESALEKEFAQKRDQVDAEFRRREKKRAIAQAVVNGALGITKIIATSGLTPIAGIQIALATALTAAQIATIAAQKFQRGGVLNGSSHANGGIPAIVNGQRPVELEGGEAVINKRSTRMFKPLLSAINVAGGGVKFQTGGLTGAVPVTPAITSNPFGAFANVLNEIRSETKATQELALSVRESVINLNVNLDTDELEGVQNTKVILDDIKTLS